MCDLSKFLVGVRGTSSHLYIMPWVAFSIERKIPAIHSLTQEILTNS